MSGSIFLDSEVAYWAMSSYQLIGPKAMRLLVNSNRALVSAVTLAELQIKFMEDSTGGVIEMDKILTYTGFEVASFGCGSATTLRDFRHTDGLDPFMRMTLAHAAEIGANLLTNNKTLLSIGLDWVYDAIV